MPEKPPEKKESLLDTINRFAEGLKSEKRLGELLEKAKDLHSKIKAIGNKKKIHSKEKDKMFADAKSIVEEIYELDGNKKIPDDKKNKLLGIMDRLVDDIKGLREDRQSQNKSLMDNIAGEKKQIEKKSFFAHLAERRKNGKFNIFKRGLGGLIDEYQNFTQQKEATLQKYVAYETVVAGSTDTTEYYVMLILSCIITLFGLYQNSPAVIIGAMIVAPLMGPIFGFSAGILWGSGEVIWEAITTLVKGSILVVLIGALATFILPGISITTEMLARSKPTLFDIVVALACGFIGAYAYVNKKVSSAIPGVAIAVALMPPVTTIGIGLGMLNFELAGGAALLFLVNFIGISLAALVVFYLVRLNPKSDDMEEQLNAKKRAIGQVIVSTLLLIVISVPLVYFMVTTFQTNREQQIIRKVICKSIPEENIYSLDIKSDNNKVITHKENIPRVKLVVLQYSNSTVSNTAMIESDISNSIGRSVDFQVFVLEQTFGQ